jgi:hypothetical protein
MIGPGDIYQQRQDESERGCLACRECDGLYDVTDSSDGLCPDCDRRLRPLCTCGCEEEATLVADLYVDGQHDCRGPWLNIEHALEAVDSTDPDAHVDVQPLDPLSEIIKAAPCWCSLHVEWCPHCGIRP